MLGYARNGNHDLTFLLFNNCIIALVIPRVITKFAVISTIIDNCRIAFDSVSIHDMLEKYPYTAKLGWLYAELSTSA